MFLKLFSRYAERAHQGATVAGDHLRSTAVVVENAPKSLSRHDGASVIRACRQNRRRLAVKAQALGREALAQIASVATPATLLRWYRYVIAAKYDGSKNRSPGRPPTAKDIRDELIVRVARENPTWGYTRLRGAPKNLKHRH